MTCDQAKEQLVLLAYEELDVAAQEHLELHLHGCPECEEELALLSRFSTVLQQETISTVTPNLLASSRLKLDEALDETGHGSWFVRLIHLVRNTWRHLYAAPALATLLVGTGFIGGNTLARYQFDQRQAAVAQKNVENEVASTVGTVNGIYAVPGSDTVQVTYDRITPATLSGKFDDPLVRHLLMIAAQGGADNDVRAASVGYLADECLAGHGCEHAAKGENAGLRDALLVSLRYDKSASVRLKALAGLKPFVAEDQRVRDAILESLSSDPSAEVRKHAVGMLAPVQGDSSVRRVLHTVSTQDENPYIRTISMQALGSVNGLQ